MSGAHLYCDERERGSLGDSRAASTAPPFCFVLGAVMVKRGELHRKESVGDWGKLSLNKLCYPASCCWVWTGILPHAPNGSLCSQQSVLVKKGAFFPTPVCPSMSRVSCVCRPSLPLCSFNVEGQSEPSMMRSVLPVPPRAHYSQGTSHREPGSH